MRPTDENQHGATRPNLVSARRRNSADDDNLLARLERDAARQAHGNRNRAAWLTAAATMVMLVLILVAWVAYDNFTTQKVVPITLAPRDTVDTFPASSGAVAGSIAGTPPSAVSVSPVGLRQSLAPAQTRPSVLPPEAQHDAAPRGGIATGGLPPAPGDPAGTVVPPLVLLRKPAAAPTPAPPRVDTFAAATSTALQGPSVARTRESVAGTPAPSHATSRAPATARPRKPSADGNTADPVMDNDVELLSAIIIHDGTHAAEKARMEASAACAHPSERRCAGAVTPRR